MESPRFPQPSPSLPTQCRPWRPPAALFSFPPYVATVTLAAPSERGLHTHNGKGEESVRSRLPLPIRLRGPPPPAPPAPRDPRLRTPPGSTVPFARSSRPGVGGGGGRVGEGGGGLEGEGYF